MHPSGLAVRRPDAARVQPIEWLWQRRLVIGALNLLVGEEGIGKSTLAAWIMAQVTRGKLKGSLYGQPANVAIVGDEDDFDRVWVPRLKVVGADLRRVQMVEGKANGPVDLRQDSGRLRDFLSQEAVRLLFFDQLLDNLGPTDSWKDKAVRDALAPIRAVIKQTDSVALTTLHPNKRQGSFRDRVSGTPAFNALARSSLLVGPHPIEQGRLALVRGKGNYSEEPQSFEFEIEAASFALGSGASRRQIKTNRVCRPRFGHLASEDVCNAYDQLKKGRHGLSRVDEAERLLAKLFADGKRRTPGSVQSRFEKNHRISPRTTADAARRLGLLKVKDGFPAQTYWVLRKSSTNSEG
jgi:hypothetical protein